MCLGLRRVPMAAGFQRLSAYPRLASGTVGKPGVAHPRSGRTPTTPPTLAAPACRFRRLAETASL